MNAVAVASTPRRPPRTDQDSKPATGVANSAELSRRGGSSTTGSVTSAVKDTSPEDGYASSQSSRHDSRDFTFGEDEGEGEPGYESDASARGLIMDMMGLRSPSADGWSPEGGEGGTPDDTVLRDVEAGQPGRRGAQEDGQAAQGQGQGRAPTSRREWLEQFCSTPMRDPTNSPVTSSGLSVPGRSLGPSAVTKAWAAVGRIDGGSGQLLGQVRNTCSLYLRFVRFAMQITKGSPE